MNTTHRQNIESAWDNLLEAVAEARQDAGSSVPVPVDLYARLDTLYASLRGIGNAWTAIRDLFPAEQTDAADQPDALGALPQSAYYKPLARALLALGGQAATDTAIAKVGRLLENQFNGADKEPLPKTGQIRWMVNVRFARLQLKNIGLIRADTQAGLWELTEAGKRWADSDMKRLPNPVPQSDPNQQVLPF
jgi:hypothetical protein